MPKFSFSNCQLCPHKCRVNRLQGEIGICNSNPDYNIAAICQHFGEEPVFDSEFGVCNIFFGSCNLSCIYCQNYQISDKSYKSESYKNIDDVIYYITEILDKGCRYVGFVSSSHFLPHVEEIILTLRGLNYNPIFIYNSNGFENVDSLKKLENLIDVYLPDYKYVFNDIAFEYSEIENYSEISLEAIKEMYRQKGNTLRLSKHNEIESGLIIRHLVLPGNIENSKAVLKSIAENISPRVCLSLMSQYTPINKVRNHPILGRVINKMEYEEVKSFMYELGITNGWTQEYDSTTHYKPDFNNINPFKI